MAGKVTVACKLPNGLRIHVDEMMEFDEPVMGGGVKTTKRAMQKGGTVFLKGYAVHQGRDAKHPVIGGYGLTHNVDADFFKAWLEQNKDSAVVVNRLIFAHEKQYYTADKADERKDVRNGFEPVNPNKLPKGIETSPDHKPEAL